MAGGVIGAEAGKGDQRAVAIVVGTVIGAVIGAEIGRRMDRTDRSCVGHALELAACQAKRRTPDGEAARDRGDEVVAIPEWTPPSARSAQRGEH